MPGSKLKGNISLKLYIDEPGWVALRIRSENTNELGGKLFGHTSAVYFTSGGKTIFRRDVALDLIGEMQAAKQLIERDATFAKKTQKKDVWDVYDQGIQSLRVRLDEN